MRFIKSGSTSQTLYVSILDSTSTTGGRKTGLVYNTASLKAYYVRNMENATPISLVTLVAANSVWSSGGFKEVDATNTPGIYRLDIPNAAIAVGVKSVVIVLKGDTGMVQAEIEIQLTTVDLQDSVRGGMTSLPNAVAETLGGLYTRGTGAGQINQTGDGDIDVNTIKINGTSQTARDIGASVLLSSGTGTGQISLSSGGVLLQPIQTGVTIPTVTTLTNGVTVTTNNDKTGYTVSTVSDKTGYDLSSGGIYAIWDSLLTGITTASSIGKLIKDYLNVAVSTRSSHTAADVWTSPTRTLTSGGGGSLTAADVWTYSTRTLTATGNTTALLSGESVAVNQEPGKLDITTRKGNDTSFDVNFGIDLTEYDYVAYIVPLSTGSVEIPIVITPIDLTLGQLHFFISKVSIEDMPILTNKHKWYMTWNTPKQEIPPIDVYTRTVLSGSFNVLGK